MRFWIGIFLWCLGLVLGTTAPSYNGQMLLGVILIVAGAGLAISGSGPQKR